ncbi:MAG: PadR family transcriptional regulator [Actinomycetota bacterium]
MIKFLLLGLLAKCDRHGYELKGLFEQLFGGTWPLNPGQVYMTLERLEEAGLVTSKRVEQELLPDRRVYSITEDGRQELKRWTAEPAEGPIRLRDELFAKVLTAMLSEQGDAIGLIWAQRRTHMQALADLRARRSDPSLHPATRLVLQGAILRTEADLRWLDQCEEYLREEDLR